MARHVHVGFPRRKARGQGWLLLAFAAICVTAALVRSAQAAHTPPALVLGPVAVDGKTAVVTGTVGGDPGAQANVEVNGHAVGVDASSSFTAVVDLNRQSYVVLTLRGGRGEITTIRIPVALIHNGVTGLLDQLEAAGISLEIPADGFQAIDGQLPAVNGRVLNRKTLGSLTVDGKDVLTVAGPGGVFSAPTSNPNQVTVVATDRQGVSQTTTYPVQSIVSTIKTSVGTSVSALGAKGLRIAKVSVDKRRLLTQRRLGVRVLVKDRRGYLVRGAAVRLRGMPAGYFWNGSRRAGFTNGFGVKRFTYVLQKRALTQQAPRRLTLAVRGSAPRAAAFKLVKVRLPLVPST